MAVGLVEIIADAAGPIIRAGILDDVRVPVPFGTGDVVRILQANRIVGRKKQMNKCRNLISPSRFNNRY